MGDDIYGHVRCPNCGMILMFTTKPPTEITKYENSFEPYIKPKQFNSEAQRFESMCADIRRIVRGAWARMYKHGTFLRKKACID